MHIELFFFSKKNVFYALIMRIFMTKNQKILNVGENRQFDEKECFFAEKTIPSFKIASLPNC